MSKRRPQWGAKMNRRRIERTSAPDTGDGYRPTYTPERWTALDSAHTAVMSTTGKWVHFRRPDINYDSTGNQWSMTVTAGELNKLLREAEHNLVKIGPTTYDRDTLRGLIMKLPSKTEIHLKNAMTHPIYPIWGTFQFDDEPYEFMVCCRVNDFDRNYTVIYSEEEGE